MFIGEIKMKKNQKRLISVTFLLIIISLGILQLNTVRAEDSYDYFKFKIDDAYYGDFDSDQNEDDIRIIASISTDYEGLIISNLKIDITLPSGFVHHFTATVFAEMDDDDEGIVFIITAYNTATEPGWYNAEIEGLFFLEDGQIILQKRDITFDPPDENPGTGEPTIEVTIR